MPFHWIRITSSPPQKRRDDVKKICKDYGARLCEEQTFYDGDGQAYALVELPAETPRVEELLDELNATSWKGLVHADEKAGGTSPPKSKKRDASS